MKDTHEPELVVDDPRNDGRPFYLSDDGHGTKIAWDTCHRWSGGCGKNIMRCDCKGGPVEPNYIARWRAEALGVVFDVVKRVIPKAKGVREALAGIRHVDPNPAPMSMTSFIDQDVIDRVKAAKEEQRGD